MGCSQRASIWVARLQMNTKSIGNLCCMISMSLNISMNLRSGYQLTLLVRLSHLWLPIKWSTIWCPSEDSGAASHWLISIDDTDISTLKTPSHLKWTVSSLIFIFIEKMLWFNYARPIGKPGDCYENEHINCN